MSGVVIVMTGLLAAGIMGFANQRGGTCTVAAIKEIVKQRRFGRALALLETSLWIAGALVVLSALGFRPQMPAGYSATLATVVGGILFGIGAFVNRACIFGSVARLGSGEWAYLATPVGYFVGCLVGRVLPAPGQVKDASLILSSPMWLALLAGAMLAARSFAHARSIRKGVRALEPIWSPHLATMVIGLTFLVGLLATGGWTYSEFLTDLARGEMSHGPGKIMLNVALVGGAILGGWSAGKIRMVRPDLASVLRTSVGGAIMGLGGAMIPGGNTGLILIGVPMLWSYAWLAFATICITIYVCVRMTSAR